MLTETSCEICGKNDWKVLGQRTYRESDAGSDWPYGQKRFKVLFDKWFPGRKSVTLTSTLCGHCGFIIYLPRPQVKDIDTKYRYLEELGQDDGGAVPYDAPVEIYRSNQILRYVSRNIRLSDVNTILDYGGGDGRLMQAFRDLNKQCFLVDYNRNCIPGVTKLSDTIDDLDQSERFDLIVCSHVMEHVSQPLQVLKKLTSHLSENGNIFIEVPMEVWKKPPLQREPVTHVNFFVPSSLHNLLLLSGLVVSKCEVCVSSYQYAKLHAVRAIGRRPSDPALLSDTPLVSSDAMNFLEPNIYDVFRYKLKKIPGKILSKLKSLK